MCSRIAYVTVVFHLRGVTGNEGTVLKIRRVLNLQQATSEASGSFAARGPCSCRLDEAGLTNTAASHDHTGIDTLACGPVLDEDRPFKDYDPKVICGRRSPEAVDTESNDGQHATL